MGPEARHLIATLDEWYKDDPESPIDAAHRAWVASVEARLSALCTRPEGQDNVTDFLLSLRNLFTTLEHNAPTATRDVAAMLLRDLNRCGGDPITFNPFEVLP
jgi:hypothetical protein